MDDDPQRTQATTRLDRSMQTGRGGNGIVSQIWGIGDQTFEQAVGQALAIYEWLTLQLAQYAPSLPRCFLGLVYCDEGLHGRTVILAQRYECRLPLNGTDPHSLGAITNDVIKIHYPPGVNQVELWAVFPDAPLQR